MLESLSTNVLSSQLRTVISDGMKSMDQKHAAAADQQKVDAEPSKERVQEVVKSMNSFLQPTFTSVRFEFHEELQKYYVKVVDDQTQETIREIPPKKLLDFYAAMTEFVGIFVDEKR
jgi:flagellar protein FlaG